MLPTKYLTNYVAQMSSKTYQNSSILKIRAIFFDRQDEDFGKTF